MEEMILLTKEQADKVRGRHGKYSALEPVVLDDGSFMLPVDVLKDPENAEVLDDLLKCNAAVINKSVIIDKKIPAGDPSREKVIYSVTSIIPIKQEWLPEGKKKII